MQVLKQGTVRFSVFDENEEDTEAALGFASLPLAPLLQLPTLEQELQLVDTAGQLAGSLVLALELRQTLQPKPIQLRRSADARGADDPERAAAAIQSHYRGRNVRKHGGPQMVAEPAAPLVVSVHRLRLAPEVPMAGVGSVWVEVDLLGLHAPDLKSKRLKARDAEREVRVAPRRALMRSAAL